MRVLYLLSLFTLSLQNVKISDLLRNNEGEIHWRISDS